MRHTLTVLRKCMLVCRCVCVCVYRVCVVVYVLNYRITVVFVPFWRAVPFTL